MNIKNYNFNNFENYVYNLFLDYIKKNSINNGNLGEILLADENAQRYTNKLLTFYDKDNFEVEFENRKNKFLNKIKNINNLSIKNYIFRDFGYLEILFDKNIYFGKDIRLNSNSNYFLSFHNDKLITKIEDNKMIFSENSFRNHMLFSFSEKDMLNFNYLISSNKRNIFEIKESNNIIADKDKNNFDDFLNKLKESFFFSISLSISEDDYGINFSNIINNLIFLKDMYNINLSWKKYKLDQVNYDSFMNKDIFEENIIKESIIEKKIGYVNFKNETISAIDMLSLTKDIDLSFLKKMLSDKKNSKNIKNDI